ncbi:hypothetical protein KCF3NO3_06540 [Chryseobacterium sp. KCF3-3]
MFYNYATVYIHLLNNRHKYIKKFIFSKNIHIKLLTEGKANNAPAAWRKAYAIGIENRGQQDKL